MTVEHEYDQDRSPCDGWYYDDAGNVVCPTCGVIDPDTGEMLK